MTAVPAFELSIVKQNTVDYVEGRTQAYRVILIASVVRGFEDPAIFRFRRLEDDRELFDGICSPADLVDFAIDVPDDQGVLRRSMLDLTFASKSLAIETTDVILDDIKVLTDEMAKVSVDISEPSVISIASDATIDVV